jgi:hypothetical protein
MSFGHAVSFSKGHQGDGGDSHAVGLRDDIRGMIHLERLGEVMAATCHVVADWVSMLAAVSQPPPPPPAADSVTTPAVGACTPEQEAPVRARISYTYPATELTHAPPPSTLARSFRHASLLYDFSTRSSGVIAYLAIPSSIGLSVLVRFLRR